MIDHRFNWTVLPSLNDVIEKRTIVFALRFDLRIIDELIQLEIRNLELVTPVINDVIRNVQRFHFHSPLSWQNLFYRP